MIRVCHVITRMILGGAQENTLLTVRGLHKDENYDVKLVTGPSLGPEGELIEKARTFGLDPLIIDDLRREIDPIRDIKAGYKLYEHFNYNNYDIVHTHSSKAGILGRWAAKLANIPWIYHTIHGLPFHEYQSWIKYWLFRTLEKATANITYNIQTVCDRMAEKAANAGLEPVGEYETVYSGMELAPFLDVPDRDTPETRKIRRKWGFDSDHFVFGKIARLFHLKGHRYCLEAFKMVSDRHPEVRLLLVGDGILRDELESQARKLGIRRKITFSGLVPYQQIPEMLTAMDALVHASLREGLARVLPQAQAAGRPVISFDIDGAPEAIQHGKTGFLVTPESVKELSYFMNRIIEEGSLREKMIKQAREWVRPQFYWQHMVGEIKKSYENVLEKSA